MLETMLNGSLVEVSDLDAEWLLDLAADAEVRERQAGRAKLRVAAQWCVLHPATAESGFVTWSDTGLPGLCPEDEALGGEGTPLVAAFTPPAEGGYRRLVGNARRSEAGEGGLRRVGARGQGPQGATPTATKKGWS